MGGLVSVVIRRSSGAIQKLILPTNILPFAFINPKMIAEDKTLINYLIARYDVNSNIRFDKESSFEDFIDKPELDFTGDYCPKNSALAPFDYGLIVIDFVNKTLRDMQWACSLEEDIDILFKKNLSQCNELLEIKDSSIHVLKEFYSLGMLKSVNFYNIVNFESSDKKIPIKDFDLDFDEIITLIATDDTEKKRAIAKKVGLCDTTMYHGFNIETPIKLTRYERTYRELIRYKNDLISSGFKISPEEEEIWKAAFEQYKSGCL